MCHCAMVDTRKKNQFHSPSYQRVYAVMTQYVVRDDLSIVFMRKGSSTRFRSP